MSVRRIVHTTTTGQPPADEGRDIVPTREERIRPYSLDAPKRGGTLDLSIKLSPAVLRYVKRECAALGIKLSDCTFGADGSVIIPNSALRKSA